MARHGAFSRARLCSPLDGVYMHFRNSLLATIVVALALSNAANAATVETVVVTASPPDPVGNDAFSVTRLTSDDLNHATELDTALEQVPGLSLFRRDSSLSANPTTQGVSLRSIGPSGAGRALVTLDGVPQNDPFGGWVIWSSLPSESIGDIRIVRGAGSGPYGAGALTGVVDLSERTEVPRGLAGEASAGSRGGDRVALVGQT